MQVKITTVTTVGDFFGDTYEIEAIGDTSDEVVKAVLEASTALKEAEDKEEE